MLVSLMRTRRTAVAIRLNGISLARVFFFTGRLAMIAAVPQINKRLEIFDPTILEMRRSVSPLEEAIRFTKSSGAEVPKARIVSPTTIGGILKLLATLLLPPTSISPHHTREMSPKMINTDAKTIPNHHSNSGLVRLIIPPVKMVNKRIKSGI